MGCASPYVVRHPDGLIDRVRCGRCTFCLVRRKQAWVGRLRLEASDHLHSSFVTLTYAEDPGILEVRDLQLFLKRFRVRWGKARYFAVGEYGEEHDRGHWHLIVFGPEIPFGRAALSDVWDAGFSFVGDIRRGSLGYVAGYALKEGRPDRPRIARMSLRPGIGFDRVAFMARELAKVGIPYWPATFQIGENRYPLCDGAIRHFIKEFLNAGGRPPALLTPEERDVVARISITDWGTRIQEDRRRRFSELVKGRDRYGSSQARGKRSPA